MQHADGDGLAVDQCWAFLREGWLGRLAVCEHALPVVLPVEYRVDADELAICLGQYRLHPRAFDGAVVGFATDHVDPVTHAGWAIQVQGLSRSPTPATVSTACGQHEDGQIVYLTPYTITGQTLRLCPYGTALPDPSEL